MQGALLNTSCWTVFEGLEDDVVVRVGARSTQFARFRAHLHLEVHVFVHLAR